MCVFMFMFVVGLVFMHVHSFREVRGKTLGVVGYGRIGSQVSIMAEAMGMKVGYAIRNPAMHANALLQIR